jgi:hypothetical protein
LIGNDQLDTPIREYLAAFLGNIIVRNDRIDLIETGKMGDTDISELCLPDMGVSPGNPEEP